MHPQPHFSTGQGTVRVERWAAEVRLGQLPTPTTPTLVPQPPKPVPHPPSTKPFTSDHCFLERNPRQPSEEVPAARLICHCRFPFPSPTLHSRIPPPGNDSSTVHPAPAPAAVCSPRPSLSLCALTCCVCLAGLCSTPRVLHSHAHLTTRCALLLSWVACCMEPSTKHRARTRSQNRARECD